LADELAHKFAERESQDSESSEEEKLDYGLATPEPKIKKTEQHDDQFIGRNSVDQYTKNIREKVAQEEKSGVHQLTEKGKVEPTNQQNENAESEMSENDN
jgi:hypothetical protein